MSTPSEEERLHDTDKARSQVVIVAVIVAVVNILIYFIPEPDPCQTEWKNQWIRWWLGY
jgi:uncharacterized membrane protein